MHASCVEITAIMIIPQFGGDESLWLRPVFNVELRSSGRLRGFNVGDSEAKWESKHEVDTVTAQDARLSSGP
jgi:hypothetical protein